MRTDYIHRMNALSQKFVEANDRHRAAHDSVIVEMEKARDQLLEEARRLTERIDYARKSINHAMDAIGIYYYNLASYEVLPGDRVGVIDMPALKDTDDEQRRQVLATLETALKMSPEELSAFASGLSGLAAPSRETPDARESVELPVEEAIGQEPQVVEVPDVPLPTGHERTYHHTVRDYPGRFVAMKDPSIASEAVPDYIVPGGISYSDGPIVALEDVPAFLRKERQRGG